MSCSSMEHIEQKLADRGLSLPSVPPPAGCYVTAVPVGNIIYTSGHLPLTEGKLLAEGSNGRIGERHLDAAIQASRIALLNALASIRSAAGSLDAVERVIKLTVYVASEPFFNGQHLVADGASFLLRELFGERGIHVRSAVGVGELPLGASLELELIVQFDPLYPLSKS
ncbi:RidA family protein [Chlorobium phaeovibrioides]|uniref:RidA family protein n=2 Tax=Chlorobium phaeovibrioides TaxID=1094 RepID=A0A5M8IB32_CHLPH|nr:RidA family protein [Chlorobium phaeovibrioides]MWV53710.1 RidA family protein [Chlorobium phaeovibrioides]